MNIQKIGFLVTQALSILFLAGCTQRFKIGANFGNLTNNSTTSTATTALSGPKVGSTNYETPPFESDFLGGVWNAGSGVDPVQLFAFDPTAATNAANCSFKNPALMSKVAAIADGIYAKGLIPLAGAQRWEDTFEISFSPTEAVTLFGVNAGFAQNEPSWLTADRAKIGNSYTNVMPYEDPAFLAFRQFILKHKQFSTYDYSDWSNTGGDPSSLTPWGGMEGYIPQNQPLAPSDCPPDMQSSGCEWGDSWAYRYAQTMTLTHVNAIQLSDYSGGYGHLPYSDRFNPAIVNQFQQYQASIGHPQIPPSFFPQTSQNTKALSSWVTSNVYNDWVDFQTRGYNHYLAAIANRITAATGHPGLVSEQCGGSPAAMRLAGDEHRTLFTQYLNPGQYVCAWDNQIANGDPGRGGPANESIAMEWMGPELDAAREPLARNGANLEAMPKFATDLVPYYPTLTTADLDELGPKLLKRLWMGAAWIHIVDRSGNLRRSLAYLKRTYFDAGVLDPTLQNLIQTIRPVKPFGPALYYPVSVERAMESKSIYTGYLIKPQISNHPTAGANNMYDFQFIMDSGTSPSYFLSDVTLGTIHPGSPNVPSAFIVIDDYNQLPPAELAQLTALAPVVTTARTPADKVTAALDTLPNQPLHFSAGLAGFGFIDQNNRYIIEVSSPNAQANAGAVSGTIQVSGLPNGRYNLTNLFTGITSSVTVLNGSSSIAVSLTRWDSTAYALSKQ